MSKVTFNRPWPYRDRLVTRQMASAEDFCVSGIEDFSNLLKVGGYTALPFDCSVDRVQKYKDHWLKLTGKCGDGHGYCYGSDHSRIYAYGCNDADGDGCGDGYGGADEYSVNSYYADADEYDGYFVDYGDADGYGDGYGTGYGYGYSYDIGNGKGDLKPHL